MVCVVCVWGRRRGEGEGQVGVGVGERGEGGEEGETLRLFPPKAGSRRPQCKQSPNPKSRKGGAIFSISSALDALDPDYCVNIHLDVSSWLAGPSYQCYYLHPGDDQE